MLNGTNYRFIYIFVCDSLINFEMLFLILIHINTLLTEKFKSKSILITQN